MACWRDLLKVLKTKGLTWLLDQTLTKTSLKVHIPRFARILLHTKSRKAQTKTGPKTNIEGHIISYKKS